MLRGDFRQFSVERLLRFLVALDQDVQDRREAAPRHQKSLRRCRFSETARAGFSAHRVLLCPGQEDDDCPSEANPSFHTASGPNIVAAAEPSRMRYDGIHGAEGAVDSGQNMPIIILDLRWAVTPAMDMNTLDSYDRQDRLAERLWLGMVRVHPMFTETVSCEDCERFEQFLGARLISTDVLQRGGLRHGVVSVRRELRKSIPRPHHRPAHGLEWPW